MTSYYTSNMNFQNDCVSPMTPPPSSENSLLIKCFNSGVSSDYSSPYLNRRMISYVTGSGGGSGGGSGSSRGSNRTPLSPMELSPLVKVEEDVFVMDGVMVGSKSGSKSALSSGGVGGSLYKTELCKSWEDSGYCRYGSKCQFAHGQEELRTGPNRSRTKKRIELSMSKAIPFSPTHVFSLDNTPTTPVTASSTSRLTRPSPPLHRNWCPTDDGIAVTLPGSSSNEPPTRADVDEHINNVLYGPTTRKRFSAFCDVCPE